MQIVICLNNFFKFYFKDVIGTHNKYDYFKSFVDIFFIIIYLHSNTALSHQVFL